MTRERVEAWLLVGQESLRIRSLVRPAPLRSGSSSPRVLRGGGNGPSSRGGGLRRGPSRPLAEGPRAPSRRSHAILLDSRFEPDMREDQELMGLAGYQDGGTLWRVWLRPRRLMRSSAPIFSPRTSFSSKSHRSTGGKNQTGRVYQARSGNNVYEIGASAYTGASLTHGHHPDHRLRPCAVASP